MTNRWWTYQHERFPLLAHGPLIAAFSLSALSFSSLLRGRVSLPDAGTAMVAFVSALIFFLQLRIADEFKDHKEDVRYRSYRPVPRGLVTLSELRIIGLAGALLQLALALWLNSSLALLLALVWLYLVLMSKEFFAREWLKARPFVYMWSHMLIVPLIDLYATACDWKAMNATAPPGLAWFVVLSFFNGIVIEIGRKIRAPEDEETGVETYSFLWGRKRAVLSWLAALTLTTISAWQAGRQIGFGEPVLALLGALLGTATIIGWRFLRQPIPRLARYFEVMSWIWSLLMYLSLGVLPLLMRL